jgi:hypothetical protein
LYREAAHEPVEERDDEDVCLALLDERERAAKAGPSFDHGAAADVKLLDDLDEFEPVAAARGPDTFLLFRRTDEAFAIAVADPRDANDTNGTTGG